MIPPTCVVFDLYMHSQQLAVKTHALICHSKKLEADTRIHLIIIVLIKSASY
jgi:hypothetical protein